MTIYELLLSDGRVVSAIGDTGRDAAMRYVDANHVDFIRTGVRVVSWRMPAMDRYVPKSERDGVGSVLGIVEAGEPGREPLDRRFEFGVQVDEDL
jgi:hypothetical protein